MIWRLVVPIGLLVGCKAKRVEDVPRDATAIVSDAIAAIDAAPAVLAEYPRVDALRTVTIPTAKPGAEGVGPMIAGELAIVGGSFGFAAIDYQRGGVAWTKPAGAHVAPPLVHGSSIVLVGDCERFEPVPDGEQLLGCMRVVTTTGSDEAFLAIHGRGLDAFATSTGTSALWDAGAKAVRWTRGSEAVTIELLTGAAKYANADAPPLDVVYRGTRWAITQRGGKVSARGKKPWETAHPYTAIVGIVWTADGAPLVRVLNLGAYAGAPEAHVIDMDATGSLRAAVARPTPGVALLGSGVSTQGDAAIALRLDSAHDFVAAYASNAMLMYVHVLPPAAHTRDRVGIAVADDAVVVFHDGDRLSVLPELLAPPTAPGATRSSSKNPTP